MERASIVTAPSPDPDLPPDSARDPLFLIADDLTGALDTAAQFARPTRPIDVRWDIPAEPVHGDIALVTNTREVDAATAQTAVMARLAAIGDQIPSRLFVKVDSLLRGNPVTELLAAIDRLQPDATIIAPAFPDQGRVTRGGRQYVRRDDDLTPCATDLAAELARHGRAATLCLPGESVPAGLSIFDAETDADLATVVTRAVQFGGRILWCGSAGLAKALAGEPAAVSVGLARPLLGLFGTDHPVTQRQLAACCAEVVRIATAGEQSVHLVKGRLAKRGVVFVQPHLSVAMPRDIAAARIEAILGDLARELSPPKTLLVSGGETLQALCRRLGAEKLVVTGEILPGIPVSRMVGGHFNGVTIVSKSGAFGQANLFQRLLEPSFDQN